MGGGGDPRVARQRPGAADGQGAVGKAIVRAGAAYAQTDAERMLDGARLLCSKRRFRGAIRLAILSIEEALKGTRLGIALAEQEIVTEGEWGRLRGHTHKLTGIPELVVKRAEAGLEAGADRAVIAGGARHARDLVKNLQGVKEACVYEGPAGGGHGWGAWSPGDGETEALALFALELAGAHLEMCRAGTCAPLGALVSPDGSPRRQGQPTARPGEAILGRLSAEIDAGEAADRAEGETSD